MKKIIAIGLMSAAALIAGGKHVAPAVTPVAPLEEVNPWYLGAGLVYMNFSGNNLCPYEDVTYGAMLRGGYEFNENFGIEARYAKSFWDEGPFGGSPLMHAGLFAKPQLPLGDRLNLYGLAGYGYTKNLGNGGRLRRFDSDWGFSAGVGLEFDLSDKEGDFLDNVNYDREFDGHAEQGKGWSLFVDYQRLLIKSDVPDMDMVAVGLRYDF